MLDATLSHRLDTLLACDCTASPLAPDATHATLARLLEQLARESAWGE